MLVLHASLDPGDHVLAWVESSSDAGTAAGPAPLGVTLELSASEFVDEILPLLDDPPEGVTGGDGLRALAVLVRQAAAVVVRQEYVPDVRFERAEGGASRLMARWSPLLRPASRDVVEQAVHAVPQPGRGRSFVAAVVDTLVRERLQDEPPTLVAREPRPGETLHDRWLRALVRPDATIEGPPDALDRLAAEVSDWQQRLRTVSESPWRLGLRLEEPDEPTADDEDEEARPEWTLTYLVQLRADPSVLIPADIAWKPTGADRATLATHGFHAGEHLLAPLADAAQLFDPIADGLATPQPTGCMLTTDQAHAFLEQVAPLLEQADVLVQVPGWWSHGRGRVSLRARVLTELHGGRQHMDSLNLATLVGYDWRAAVGGAELTYQELQRLAEQKSGLVRVRGRWVALDTSKLQAALEQLARTVDGGRFATLAELVHMQLGAAADLDGLTIDGVSVGEDGAEDIADLLARAARHEPLAPVDVPVGLDATLRPYQERGFQWLVSMAQLGLGACLADDMGLGKTLQLLAAVQHAWEQDDDGGERAPTLVVCPTTVLTNWRREAERFTPQLPLLVHHGPGRARGEQLADAARAAAVVFTSYAVLARDVEALREVGWRAVVLDEAQNIKNPGTRHARAARSLRARARVALTGTPIENHAGDLWSIMEFLNPGLLGSQADFRRKYLIPIQTGTFPEAAERLRTVVAPFVLRREKTDPAVISDLPDKLEQVSWCHLTTEQVSLYEAIVRETAEVLRMPAGAARRSGIERRGLILATIARLKQACNHPAQLLADGSAVAGRSGKLQRLDELLDAVIDRGERALVFTQYVAMGELLQAHLCETFGVDVPFLHGGTSRADRDRMVQRFQTPGADAPPVLLLSLKAGGSGLNLTAATHVIHYDRWWNPATEQQATDRAYRIGQTRDVQVHALVCTGTVEERIDHMLHQKRGVAASVVGSGEQWVTELGDDELLDLLALRTETMLQDGRLDDLDPKEWQRGTL
jgi:superfamily II DNA or RNA helicase